MTRYLGPTEKIFLFGGLSAICLVELTGRPVRSELLDEAFGVLAEENPVLRSRIESTDQGDVVRAADSRPTVVVRTGVADPTELEANTTQDPYRALSRVTLYQGDGGDSILALAIHHSFTDGVLVTVLTNRLLSYYTALAAGDSLRPVARDEYEKPLEELLDSTLAPAAPPRVDAPVITFPRAVDPPAGPPIAVRGVRFSEEETRQLLGSAKLAGLSPFGLFTGAAAAALPSEAQADSGIVTVWSLVSLRERLEPPVSHDANMFCAGLAVLALHSPDPNDHVGFGSQAMTQLKAALAEEVPQRMVKTMAERGPVGFPAISFTMSNAGRFDTPALPPGMRLVAQRGVVPPDPNSPIPTIIIITVDGRLGFDVVYSRATLDEGQVGGWVERIRSIVLAT